MNRTGPARRRALALVLVAALALAGAPSAIAAPAEGSAAPDRAREGRPAPGAQVDPEPGGGARPEGAASPAAGLPAPPPTTAPLQPDLSGDPFARLGGTADCSGLSGQELRNCHATGSAAHGYPIDNYAFDIHIGHGVTDPEGAFFNALQSLVAYTWLGLLYMLKGILALLTQAFRLNLLDGGMAGVRGALGLAQTRLTEPWLLAAISALGLWGIWRGLVAREVARTVGGIGLSLALMAGGFWLIARPEATIGAAGRLVDQAALSALGTFDAAPQSGQQALAAGQRALFEALALPGFCILQFQDVSWCEAGALPAGTPHLVPAACVPGRPWLPCRPIAGARPARTPAELFLRYPANGDERNAVYDAWKDRAGTPEGEAMALMRGRGPTGKRIGLLLLIAIGLVPALLLFGLIAFRLAGFALLVLVLLLFAPVMLIVAAFGDAGRRAVAAWARWLLGSLVGKLVYAVLLAVVVVCARVVALVGVGGWIGTWTLLTTLWVTLLVERQRLAGWLSAGVEDGAVRHSALRALGAAYLGTRVLREAGHAGALPLRAARRRYDQYRLGSSEGARAAARAGLSVHAERALGAELERDRLVLAQRGRDRDELARIEQTLQPVEVARQRGEPVGIPPQAERRLRGRAEELRRRIEAPEALRAEAHVRRAADAEAREGRSHTDEDTDAWIARRRRELSGRAGASRPPSAGDADGAAPRSPSAAGAGGRFPGEPAHSAARGEPADLAAAERSPTAPAGPAAEAERIQAALAAARAAAEQRQLLRSLPADPTRRASGRGVRRVLGPQRLRRAQVEAADALEAERRLRRARARIFRAPRL